MKNNLAVVLTACVATATNSAHAFDLDDYNKRFGTLSTDIAAARQKSPPIDSQKNFSLTIKKKSIDTKALTDATAPVELGDGGGFTLAEGDLALYNQMDKSLQYVLANCEGRITQLNTTLQRSMKREEKVALAGGVVGMLGAIATCPHCAAFASGVAGVASLFQQVSTRVGSDSQAVRAQLEGVSTQILTDIKAYRDLPDPLAATSTAEFRTRIGKRKDQITFLVADCAMYSTTFKSATTDASAKPVVDAGTTPTLDNGEGAKK